MQFMEESYEVLQSDTSFNPRDVEMAEQKLQIRILQEKEMTLESERNQLLRKLTKSENKTKKLMDQILYLSEQSLRYAKHSLNCEKKICGLKSILTQKEVQIFQLKNFERLALDLDQIIIKLKQENKSLRREINQRFLYQQNMKKQRFSPKIQEQKYNYYQKLYQRNSLNVEKQNEERNKKELEIDKHNKLRERMFEKQVSSKCIKTNSKSKPNKRQMIFEYI